MPRKGRSTGAKKELVATRRICGRRLLGANAFASCRGMDCGGGLRRSIATLPRQAIPGPAALSASLTCHADCSISAAGKVRQTRMQTAAASLAGVPTHVPLCVFATDREGSFRFVLTYAGEIKGARDATNPTTAGRAPVVAAPRRHRR
jgi:hypothetical protein